MEYVYAVMLLHKAGKQVDHDGVKKVLEAAGVHADEARIKALLAALEGVNIDEAVKKAAVAAPVAVAAAPAAGEGAKEKKQEKSHAQEEKKSEEAAAAGLGALFG